MVVLDPVSGRNVEITTPPRTSPTAREDRETARAARIAEKAQARAAAWTLVRRAELDAGAL